MILSEKGLIKQMKEAYKAGGYDFVMDSQQIIVAAPTWLIRCSTRMFPKEALGLVVQHIGALPDHPCYHVSKAAVQTAMESVVRSTLEGMENLTPETGDALKKTCITWKGTEVWQRCKDLAIVRMDPALTDLVASMKIDAAVCSTEGIYVGFYGEASAVWLTGCKNVKDDDTLGMDYLSGYQWN